MENFEGRNKWCKKVSKKGKRCKSFNNKKSEFRSKEHCTFIVLACGRRDAVAVFLTTSCKLRGP